MILYKVKVYLPDTQIVKLINSDLFSVIYTNWTYVMSTARDIITHVLKKDEMVSFFYRDCAYVDRSDWVLQQIDSFVDKNDLVMPADYKVFSRAYHRLPLYDQEDNMAILRLNPDSFTEQQVKAQFPLALIWKGAYIGSAEYILVDGCLIRRNQRNSVHMPRTMVPKNTESEVLEGTYLS